MVVKFIRAASPKSPKQVRFRNYRKFCTYIFNIHTYLYIYVNVYIMYIYTQFVYIYIYERAASSGPLFSRKNCIFQ